MTVGYSAVPVRSSTHVKSGLGNIQHERQQKATTTRQVTKLKDITLMGGVKGKWPAGPTWPSAAISR